MANSNAPILSSSNELISNEQPQFESLHEEITPVANEVLPHAEEVSCVNEPVAIKEEVSANQQTNVAELVKDEELKKSSSPVMEVKSTEKITAILKKEPASPKEDKTAQREKEEAEIRALMHAKADNEPEKVSFLKTMKAKILNKLERFVEKHQEKHRHHQLSFFNKSNQQKKYERELTERMSLRVKK